MPPPIQFKRFRTTPVLAKGGTYDGWAADALASPSACWDGSRFVMAVSIWSISAAKWATGFFTSPDLETWTYVTGSLRPPTGSDYILGNGSLVWFAGKYYYGYTHYPAATVSYATRLDTSTDLLTWTNVLDPVPGSGVDSRLSVSPITGHLECWSIDSSRRVVYSDSPDGLTWTSHGVYLTAPAWCTVAASFGSPGVYYDSGVRYCVPDVTSGANAPTAFSNVRLKALFSSPTLDTTWTTNGTCLGADPFNAWESVQAFDNGTAVQSGPWDRGDGRGPQVWLLYAGGDNASATDATDSSIGLAFAAPAVAAATFLPAWAASSRNATIGCGVY